MSGEQQRSGREKIQEEREKGIVNDYGINHDYFLFEFDLT